VLLPAQIHAEADVLRAAKARAKFLRKAPRIARQLDPAAKHQRRPAAFVGSELGPQLLGRVPDASRLRASKGASTVGADEAAATAAPRSFSSLEAKPPPPSFQRRSQSVEPGAMSAQPLQRAVALASRAAVDDPSSTPWLQFAVTPVS
jgi:hypothetical protein